MKTGWFWRAATVAMLLLVTYSCNRQRLEPDLQQAVDAVYFMTSERFLSRSGFRYLFPEAKPSQYVSYIFSDLGVAEWPIALDEMEEQQLRSAGIPTLPSDVVLVAQRPDPGHKQQVVLRADDSAGLVIIEAYPSPTTAPQLIIERNLNQKN